MKISDMNYPMYSALDDAIKEAERFIKKAELAKERLIDDKFAWSGTKETGAVKRASMDLTRELVNIRK